MPNFKSISFKMAVLQRAGRICPLHVLIIRKTPCGMGLKPASDLYIVVTIAGPACDDALKRILKLSTY